MSSSKHLKFGRSPPVPSNLDGYVCFENLRCVDADGHVFEEYPELLVQNDLFREADGEPVYQSSYAHAVYCEENGMFLSSFALTCQIVAASFRMKDNPTYAQLLQQYNDIGDGDGWHGQNTLIDFSSKHIIHYPNAVDFSEDKAVNTSQTRITLPFKKSSLENVLLKDALHAPASLRYVQQLTGLSDPSILVEIGEYFHKPADVRFPWFGKSRAKGNKTARAWFGCGDTDLGLDASNSMSDSIAARGVHRGGERSEPVTGGAR